MPINAEKATEIVRDYLKKSRGLEKEIAGREFIDQLDFTVNSIEPKEDYYEVRCELRENLFSEKKIKYYLKINRESGELEEVKREDEV
ncbi:MAG TPA: hypothetical protein ENG12_02930 [Candidatus Altiarchaeales archaeon]|nr:hypothetical protein [Candidatus Altiarchaeales archaeon]